MGILRDENSLLGSFSFYQNLLRMADLINFHLLPLIPSTECSFNYHIMSVKNQARLTGKIVGSYLRVFTLGIITTIYSLKGRGGGGGVKAKTQKIHRFATDFHSKKVIFGAEYFYYPDSSIHQTLFFE